MTKTNWDKLKRRDQARDAIRDLHQTQRIERELRLKAIPQLSTDEIVRRLQAIKASDQIDRLTGRVPSLRSLAMRAQVSLGHIYDIVNGCRVPTAKTAAKLSAAVQGINISELE